MTDRPVGYVLDAEALRKLKRINVRIYADKPLVGDERRDLANLMFTVLEGAQAIVATEDEKALQRMPAFSLAGDQELRRVRTTPISTPYLSAEAAKSS